jgi:hypothetical protein
MHVTLEELELLAEIICPEVETDIGLVEVFVYEVGPG